MVIILNLQTAKMDKILVFFRKINIFPAMLNFHVIMYIRLSQGLSCDENYTPENTKVKRGLRSDIQDKICWK